MNWPCLKTPQSSTPTPYDILELEKSAVYSKHKFYELVKIYHPDRHGSAGPEEPIHTLSRVERLDRYRLVVQAHEILSDPAKRQAYDVTGAGWGSKANSASMYGREYRYTSGTADSPFANATWEDWERWYARSNNPNAAGAQAYAGTYFNPNAFASIVIFLAVISGVAQATYAGTSAGSVEERARAFTAQTHKFMTDRKVENVNYLADEEGTHGTGSPERTVPVLGPGAEDRVRHFLARRDPDRYGLKEEEEEYYRKHFANRNFAPPPTKTAREVERPDR